MAHHLDIIELKLDRDIHEILEVKVHSLHGVKDKLEIPYPENYNDPRDAWPQQFELLGKDYSFGNLEHLRGEGGGRRERDGVLDRNGIFRRQPLLDSLEVGKPTVLYTHKMVGTHLISTASPVPWTHSSGLLLQVGPSQSRHRDEVHVCTQRIQRCHQNQTISKHICTSQPQAQHISIHKFHPCTGTHLSLD